MQWCLTELLGISMLEENKKKRWGMEKNLQEVICYTIDNRIRMQLDSTPLGFQPNCTTQDSKFK